jgi:fluoride ion exporter CrcB/FEX
VDAHDAAVALAYAIGSVVIGIAAVYAGTVLGRAL